MRTRGLIEQAKGMLAERMGCDPESAFGVLSAQSQQTNVPLVQIAADLVAAMPADVPRAPAELGLTEAKQEAGPLELHAATELDRRRNPPALSATANRNLRMAIAALDAAADVDELARALVTPGMKEQSQPAAAVWVTEPDGALRLLGCHGWPAQATSEWRRLPSSIHTAVGHAVRNGKPVLVDRGSKHDFVLIGPAVDVRLVFPLVTGGRVVGAFQFAWTSTRRTGEATRLYLSHLAMAAARALTRLWPNVSTEAPAQLDWVRSVMDAMQGSAHLLAPVRGAGGEIVDFIIEAASGDAPAAEVGRRLLDVYPNLAGNGVFAGYVQALTGGTIWQRPDSTEETIVNGRKRRIVMSRRASRVGGAVLATWERLDEALSRDRHLARLEALGGYGWAEWDLNTGDARWSPGMYRLLGKEQGRDPLPFDSLIDLIDPVDRSRMERFSAEALSGRDTVVDVRVKAGDEARWLRLFSEALERKAIHLLVQDVSDRYAREQHLRSMQSRAAAGRLRLASQQDLTARLVQLLYPKETVSLSTSEAVVLGRHVLSDSEQPLRADFCDAIELPDGGLFMMAGDMFGVGMPAAATAARIVRPVSALGIAGLPLQRILEVLNTDLRRDEDPSLASLLLAKFDPLTGDLSYASAGHLPAIWLRSDLSMPKLLAEATGPALGLVEKPEYQQASVELMVGDAVALYTDGVIDQRAVNPLMSLAAMFASAYRSGGSQALIELSIPHNADEACLCLLEVRGLKHPQSG